jgi:hypothetical protein
LTSVCYQYWAPHLLSFISKCEDLDDLSLVLLNILPVVFKLFQSSIEPFLKHIAEQMQKNKEPENTNNDINNDNNSFIEKTDERNEFYLKAVLCAVRIARHHVSLFIYFIVCYLSYF